MRGGVVSRYPEHRNAKHLELREVVRELAGLGRATRGVVFGIEVHDVTRTLKVFVRDDLAVLIGQGKRGCLIAGHELHQQKG